MQCDNCFYCRRGNAVLCENFHARGVTLDGGFAEYIVYPQRKCYKIHNLTDEESTLLEPAACAIHGLDKLNPPVGIDVLMLGAGPTGLILAQLRLLGFLNGLEARRVPLCRPLRHSTNVRWGTSLRFGLLAFPVGR